MLRTNYILPVFLILLNSFTPLHLQKKSIRISFVVDDVKENLSKSDRFMLINKNEIINCAIDDSAYLMLPDNINEKKYNVLFIHNNDSLFFRDIIKEIIIQDQNYEWHFGIDNKPFNRSIGLLKYDEYLTDSTTRRLIYWIFDPLEYGEGEMTYYKQ